MASFRRVASSNLALVQFVEWPVAHAISPLCSFSDLAGANGRVEASKAPCNCLLVVISSRDFGFGYAPEAFNAQH